MDPDRIAFYGLSYGGKTAMRVPALLDRYCLSICSGDFNEWVWKNASLDLPDSYCLTNEYEMFEFDLGNTFNYAEMAGADRAAAVHGRARPRRRVGIDEWVAYEYAKVRLPVRRPEDPRPDEIEYFDGPHTIHGVGTFEFLHKQLHWP